MPPCEGSPLTGSVSDVRSWDNCSGTHIFDSPPKFIGDKYVGEWKDDKKHGQGTETSAYGQKYVGEIKDDKAHGQGRATHPDGRVREGIWEKGKLLYAKKSPSTITAKKSPLDKAKEQCAEIGFTKGTEKFGDCVMKLLN